MQYWEIVADKLSAAGWSWGYCGLVTKEAQTSCDPIIGNYGSLSTRYWAWLLLFDLVMIS